MSNKKWKDLLVADRWIRRLAPNKGMTRGSCDPQIRITLVRGFELFNTRAYHNYENWAAGYIVEAFDLDGKLIAKVEAEDLDVALLRLGGKLGVNPSRFAE